MNTNATEELNSLKQQVTVLTESLGVMEKTISALKIDLQRAVQSNPLISPGVGCKVAYDSKGLVLKRLPLEASDIPELQIDQIAGLRSELGSKANASTVAFNSSSKGHQDPGDIVATGVKVNYDKYGHVVSSSDLLEQDIPELPKSHITGLPETLKNIMERLDLLTGATSSSTDNKKIDPGTFTKITYDADGRVVSGSHLTFNDLPMDLITRVNTLESTIPTLASQQTMNTLNRTLHEKVDSNRDITPGTYTKVTVDRKGLVTRGERLTIRDLPDIEIQHVVDLELTLRKKADQSDFLQLNDTVARISQSISAANEVRGLKNEVSQKADAAEVKSIGTQVTSLRRLLDTLTQSIPNDTILDQLEVLQKGLSDLSGRISTLENMMLRKNSPSE